MTILLRFVFGAFLAAAIAVFTGLDFPLIVVFVVIVATTSAIWGDRFIFGFMSMMKYFR